MKYFPFLAFLSLIIVLILASCSEPHLPNGIKPVFPLIDQFPVWSPDGENIIYFHGGITEVREDGSFDLDPELRGIWMIDPDGTNPHLIYKAWNVIPEWSRDPDWIVFSADAQIFKAQVSGDHIDTTSIEQLTSHDENFFPTWSPDRQWIAYDSDAGGIFSIWKMRSDGTNKEMLKKGARLPQWSPDGENILHIEYLSTGVSQIYTMNAYGQNVERLVFTGENSTMPRYSHDGTKIAFVSGRYIWFMNSDGSDQYNFVEGSYPSWSPDGSKIVFLKFNEDNFKSNGTIWIVNVDSTNLYQLTFGPGVLNPASWTAATRIYASLALAPVFGPELGAICWPFEVVPFDPSSPIAGRRQLI